MKLETDRSLSSELQSLVAAASARLSVSHAVERLWARDHRLWKQDPTDIANRLGWLTIIEYMKDRTEELRTFATSAKKRGIRDVVLLGMGGSSLGPEVLRASFGSSSGFPRFGSSIPPFQAGFDRSRRRSTRLEACSSSPANPAEPSKSCPSLPTFGNSFTRPRATKVANSFSPLPIPAPGLKTGGRASVLAHLYQPTGHRWAVLGPLLFWISPCGPDGDRCGTIAHACHIMAQACESSPLWKNPGADLGATMAALAQAGRNKITLITSPQITTFGLWAEQLLAESTGKEGTGLIPVANEPIVSPTAYGTDRLFVYLRFKGDQNRQLDRQIAGLARQGHPVLTLTLQDRYDLAGEFFRWEVATAMAGHLLGIHPFDQPNVQESKDNTARVLETIQSTGRLPKQTTATAAQAAAQLKRQCRPGAYVAILAYTTPSSKMEQAIRSLRRALVSYHHVTTTAGYGPRYLHSTGQLHKGGPRSGLFLQLVDQMIPDLNIPGKPFTFRTLAQAQAAGDIQALQAHDQQAIVLPLGKNPVATIQALTKSLAPRTPARRPTIRRTRSGRARKK